MSIQADFLIPGGALASPLLAELLDPQAQVREQAPGDRVGPYRIVSELGRGGMSIVYLAERADGAYDHAVALKLLRPDLVPERARELLQRERQLLARLDHPGIARLLDGGSTEDGLLWFAMEHVDGERIDRFCTRGKLELAQRLALFLDVCSAVQHAHSRLLIHRDIKPSNILIGIDGRPRLLDFGVAGMLDDGATRHRLLGLTPTIASPEQRRGEAETTATDIFQLGLLLHGLLLEPGLEIAARTKTRSAETASTITTDASVAEMLAATLDDSVSAPRASALNGRRRDLAAVVAKAMAAQPEDRYPSAAALAAEVQAWLDHRPVGAMPDRNGYRLRRFAGRHRLALAATGLVLLVFVGMASAFVWRIQHARDVAEQARRVAETERATAQRETRKSTTMAKFLFDTFRDANPGRQGGRHMTVDELLADAPRRIDAAFADENAVRAELLAQIGYVHLELGDSSAALPLLRQAVALGSTDPDLPPRALARREAALGLVMSGTSEHAQAGRLLESVTERLQRTAAGSEEHHLALGALAYHYGRHGETLKALTVLRELVPAMEADPATPKSRLIQMMGNYAAVLHTSGNEAEFYETSRRACALARSELGPSHPATLNNCINELLALTGQRRFEEAESAGARVLEALAAVENADRSGRAAMLGKQMTYLALQQGHWQTAEQRARSALAISESLPAGDDGYSTDILGYLAQATFEQGRHAESLAAARKALDSDRRQLRVSSPDEGIFSSAVARALAALHRCDEAAIHITQARATYAEKLAAGSVATDVLPALQKNLDEVARRCASASKPSDAQTGP